MSKEKDILKELDHTCDEALSFLKTKDSEVKEKAMAVDEMGKNIDFADKHGFDKEPYTKVLGSLEDSLYKSEMNEDDLMQEHIFMAKIMDGLRRATDNESKGVGYGRDKFKAISDKLQEQNKAYEEQIKAIGEETSEKEYLRSEIVKNEGALKQNKEAMSSFDAIHSVVIKGVDARNRNIDRSSKKRDELSELLTQKENDHSEAFSNFQSSKADYVNKKLEMRAGTYIVPKEDVGKAQEHTDLSGKFVIHLEKDISELKGSIAEKDRYISRQRDEIEWLNKQSDLKDIDIDSLNGKLKAWDKNYAEFEKLVEDLSKYVGYPLNFNADGGTEGENPLIPLIEQVQSITRWLESQEDLTPVKEEPSIAPYLVGGALAMGALMMFKR